ncbi:hypothetical protein HMPREF9120_00835 [Neisseria sp. oral taxon 020 str. F0370]|nr:hypothetical protein HMPREF9120_00835 [Neisseria sp. oral taxon 020 str. F0370]
MNKTVYHCRPFSLGRVDIQLLKRILRHKMADARRKCEPMPSIGECFQRGRCRFRTEKPPKC